MPVDKGSARSPVQPEDGGVEAGHPGYDHQGIGCVLPEVSRPVDAQQVHRVQAVSDRRGHYDPFHSDLPDVGLFPGQGRIFSKDPKVLLHDGGDVFVGKRKRAVRVAVGSQDHRGAFSCMGENLRYRASGDHHEALLPQEGDQVVVQAVGVDGRRPAFPEYGFSALPGTAIVPRTKGGCGGQEKEYRSGHGGHHT